MLETLAMILIAALSLAGVIWIVEGIIINFTSCRNDYLYIVINADECSENIDMRLLEAYVHTLRMGGKSNKEIIVIDNGMSERTKNIINMKRAEFGNIRIMKPYELKNLK